MASDGDRPAFPYSALLPDGESRQLAGTMYADNTGITIRDYFAAQVLGGLVANGAIYTDGSLLDRTPERFARDCYAYADAMLVAREVKPHG